MIVIYKHLLYLFGILSNVSQYMYTMVKINYIMHLVSVYSYL